jgi:hypothetical protein
VYFYAGIAPRHKISRLWRIKNISLHLQISVYVKKGVITRYWSLSLLKHSQLYFVSYTYKLSEIFLNPLPEPSSSKKCVLSCFLKETTTWLYSKNVKYYHDNDRPMTGYWGLHLLLCFRSFVFPRRRNGCCTYSLSLMNILNQTELQFSCNFVVINASEGSLCFQIFLYSIQSNEVGKKLLNIYNIKYFLSFNCSTVGCVVLGDCFHSTISQFEFAKAKFSHSIVLGQAVSLFTSTSCLHVRKKLITFVHARAEVQCE